MDGLIDRVTAAGLSPASITTARPHIVIIGAGFGGLSATMRLGKVDADVTVIDRRNYHLFQPLLYQVATAALSPADIAAPIRGILARQPNTNVTLGTVTGLDTAGRAVLIGRRRILVAFERAEDSDDEAERRQLLTFVIVGGGPTGVELAGALAELAKAALARDFRRIDPATARIVLVEAGPRLLPSFPPKLSAVAAQALTLLGVELRLDAKVTRCDCDGAVLGDERIESRTLIWAAGVAASPAAAWLGIAAGRGGRVPVMSDLRPCCTDQLGWRLGPGSVEDVLLCESGTSGSLVRVAPPRRSPRWEGAAPIHNPLGCPLCHSKPMPIAVITSPSSRIG